MKGALVKVKSCHLARDTYVLENPDCLCFALIFGEREQLAGGLGHLVKECLLCFQKGFPVIGQMLPHLCAHLPSGTRAAGVCDRQALTHAAQQVDSVYQPKQYVCIGVQALHQALPSCVRQAMHVC